MTIHLTDRFRLALYLVRDHLRDYAVYFNGLKNMSYQYPVHPSTLQTRVERRSLIVHSIAHHTWPSLLTKHICLTDQRSGETHFRPAMCASLYAFIIQAISRNALASIPSLE